MGTDDFIQQILPLKNNLYRMAFRITGNKEQAEQIVQDAMLKVWSQRSTWMIIDDLPAYCLMVTRNIALKITIGYSVEQEYCFTR
ncbi:RNA polymerase sigma factor [Parabacteroides chinchillae]